MTEETQKLMIYAGIALAVIVLLILLILIMQNGNRRKELELMRKDVNAEMNQMQLQLQQVILQSVQNVVTSNDRRMDQLEQRVNGSMVENLKTTQNALYQMNERMVRIDETQKGLDELSVQIHSLQNVLQDKKSRGIFGEVELYNLLESVYGTGDRFYKKQVKLSNGTMVDALLTGNATQRDVPIDSKFPLEHYTRMLDESLDPQIRQLASRQFKQDVTRHMKDIREKYVSLPETADFAYMFIPAEAVYSYIYANMDDLVQLSYQWHVYIASPTTLMAYLTAMKAIYLGQKQDEKMVWMKEEFRKLALEFDRFKERYDAVTADFEKIRKDFGQVTITSEKIQKRFAQIESVELPDLSGNE
ncbi:MAG: DNA recombination protein RmuC [Erysipelotrichaceae bacterium]|nr:DNA recombination protein RmuC [Erysipelotrichaceae bacterium]